MTDWLFWFLVVDVLYLLLVGDVGPRVGPFNGVRLVLGVITLVLAVLRLAGAA